MRGEDGTPCHGALGAAGCEGHEEARYEHEGGNREDADLLLGAQEPVGQAARRIGAREVGCVCIAMRPREHGDEPQAGGMEDDDGEDGESAQIK